MAWWIYTNRETHALLFNKRFIKVPRQRRVEIGRLDGGRLLELGIRFDISGRGECSSLIRVFRDDIATDGTALE